MNPKATRIRVLLDRMLKEAALAEEYSARGEAAFFDLRSPELRDAIELRVLHFVESSTKVGKSFRAANPKVPWDDLDQLRNDLVHEYPEVQADRMWRFVRDDLPGILKRLRKPKYPPDED